MTMITFSVYLCTSLSVLIALGTINATVRYVATAFNADSGATKTVAMQ